MSLTAVAFLIAFLACAVLAFVRSPLYGLYAYAAVFYLHPVDRWWGQGLPDFRWHLLIGIITLAATLRLPAPANRPAWYRSAPAIYLGLMCLWLWIQNLWALDEELHFEVSFLYSKYLLLFFLMYRLLDSEKACWSFLRVHVLGCVYLGWLIIDAPDAGRLEGVGGPGIDEANALGMQLCTGIFSAAVLITHGPWWSRLLGLLSAPVLLNGIVQTESRGVFIATVVAAVVFLGFLPARKRRPLVVLGLAGILLFLPLVPANYWERMSTINAVTDDTKEVDRSTESRLALAQAQWQMFLKYPLGSGHRGTAALSARYLSDDFLTSSSGDPMSRARSSHNTFLSVMAEQGVPGILLFGSLCWWIARTSVALRRRAMNHTSADDAQGILLAATVAMLATVLAAGMFTDYFKAEVFVWGLSLLAVLKSFPQQAAADDPAAANLGPADPSPYAGTRLGHPA